MLMLLLLLMLMLMLCYVMYVCIHMRLVQLSSKVSILWGHVACAQPTLTHQLELYNPSGALFHRKV